MSRLGAQLREQVYRRAGDRCEYCGIAQADDPTAFAIDHIRPFKHGGSGGIDNLALACSACNLFKGPNFAGEDAVTGELSRLFNPRSDRWADHFRAIGGFIEPLTPCARVTVAILRINHPLRVAFRATTLLR